MERSQSNRHVSSRRAKIKTQRQELDELLQSGALRNYAEENLSKAYLNGLPQALAETGLTHDEFPIDCPFSLVELLSENLTSEFEA